MECANLGIGTTSAHAENTDDMSSPLLIDGNYLRARGEYSRGVIYEDFLLELPPRTRRIRLGKLIRLPTHGTTSAHAENTQQKPFKLAGQRNYLRARGEYRPDPKANRIPWELPPRTRRIPIYTAPS